MAIKSITAQVWYLFDLLVLKRIGDYAEFILPFIVYTALILNFSKFLKWSISSKIVVITISVLSYFLGFLIYNLNLGMDLNLYKGILAGHDGLYRFPLLQYLPVFLIGLYYGKILYNKTNYLNKDIIVDTIGTGTVLSISIFSSLVASVPYGESFNRWPPSIAFLSIGWFIALVIILISNWIPKIPGFITTIGQNALNIYFVHIIILEIYKLTSGVKTDNVFVLLLIVALFTWGVTQIPYKRFIGGN
jgi:hypothetical protein